MPVVTTEVDADFNPFNDGTFHPIFTFPVRPGCSQLEFFVTNNGDRNCAGRYQMLAGGPTTFLNSNFNFAATTTNHQTFTTTALGPLTTWTDCEADFGGNVGFVGTIHLKILQTWDGGSSVVCQYGTQLAAPGTFVYYLTPALIDVWLATVGMPWLDVIFTPLWFTFFNAQSLCSATPPTFPTINLNSLLQTSPNVVFQALEAVAWTSLCQCAPGPPGSAAPTSPTPPSQTQPVNWPALPTFTCDGQDPCILLNQLIRSVAALQMELQVDYQETVLIQRQKVPFGYVPGVLHTGLTGAGTFDVQGILGLSIESTTIPPYLSATMAPVNSYFKLGEVAWGTADGFEPRRIITHNPHLFTDIDGDVTQVAYLFESGVTANILELLREP